MTTVAEAIAGSREAQAALTPRRNRYMVHCPTPSVKQQAFMLLYDILEAMYGGAAGGGKSEGMLQDALQFVDVPGYAAVLLRRTYADLSKPGALIDLSHRALGPTNASWSEQRKQWRFPGGATLSFGYLERPDDIYQYQGPSYQYIGFDELTQFDEKQYRYLFSRLRRIRGVNVPLRMRAASNPGSKGHDWVKRRFITEGRLHGRVFIPARVEDNPGLETEEYVQSLMQLDPQTRAQLLSGDWDARRDGALFSREMFEVVDEAPAGCQWVRFWDLAATEAAPGTDPDWTAGAKLGFYDGVWYLQDMRRAQLHPSNVEKLVAQTAAVDGRAIPVRMEQEPGASGKAVVLHYARHVLPGFAFAGVPSTGSKLERARPVAAAAAAGNFKLVDGPWIADFLDEAEAFPSGGHDDQIDGVSGGMAAISATPVWGVV